MDEDASTTDSLGSLTRVNDDDSLGSVDPDVDPGTEPLVDSSRISAHSCPPVHLSIKD